MLLESLTFIVEYNANGANGSQCPGGHTCNRGVFNILAGDSSPGGVEVNIGQISVNNVGGPTDLLNYPPNSTLATPPGPGYPGQSNRDRYTELSIDSVQAQQIAAASPGGLIDFSFECACIWSGPNQNCTGTQVCHQDVSWVRVIKDLGLPSETELYNDCPIGNFIEDFDPCL